MSESKSEKLYELLEKFFGGTKDESEPVAEVTKSIDLEERRALFVVLEPETVDLHGDIYSAEEVEKACINFNTHCNKANLFHQVQIETAKIEQSFISPSDFMLDDGRMIKKGTWLQWWHFPEDDAEGEKLWKQVKSGDICGVSIGCRASVEEL
jgi:hypothetical protein